MASARGVYAKWRALRAFTFWRATCHVPFWRAFCYRAFSSHVWFHLALIPVQKVNVKIAPTPTHPYKSAIHTDDTDPHCVVPFIYLLIYLFSSVFVLFFVCLCFLFVCLGICWFSFCLFSWLLC